MCALPSLAVKHSHRLPPQNPVLKLKMVFTVFQGGFSLLNIAQNLRRAAVRLSSAAETAEIPYPWRCPRPRMGSEQPELLGALGHGIGYDLGGP